MLMFFPHRKSINGLIKKGESTGNYMFKFPHHRFWGFPEKNQSNESKSTVQRYVSWFKCCLTHDGSVCMVYMLTKLGYIDGRWQTMIMAYRDGSVMGYLSLVRIRQFINSTVPFPDSTNWLRFCFDWGSTKGAFQGYIP